MAKIFQFLNKLIHPVPKDEKVCIDLQGVYQGHYKVTYKGVTATRCPFDYVIYQMIIGEIRPDLIIEIGSYAGGGAMYLADLLKIYDIDGRVHAIDINDRALKNIGEYPGITFFTQGVENYDPVQTQGFRKILVIEDAAHTYACTKMAMDKFADIVSVGSYLIIEDGIVNALGMEKDFSGGPLKAIREFLPAHPQYIPDRKWCDMFGKNATFNVNGYLKRIQ